MKIAQIAPLYESCPPRFYGATEGVVAYITDELVRHGHEVTLFASGDSQTSAMLEAGCGEALRLDGQVKAPLFYHLRMLDRVRRRADEFDILHFHTDYLHFPLFAECWNKTVTTLHGRLDLPDLAVMMRAFPDLPLVSISKAQRTPMPWANWYETIQHGLPRDLHCFGEGNGGYLAFLGRISPEKRVDDAIEIARRAGLPLKIAAKVDKADEDYFKTIIRPRLREPGIEFIGEIGEAQKSDFLGNAFALLVPIDWAEPFGLVMIEAMACGTPVVARARGSVPEVIDPGLTGYLSYNLDDGVEAVKKVPELSRPRCREVFEQRFAASRMAKDYLAAYEQLFRTEPLSKVVAMG